MIKAISRGQIFEMSKMADMEVAARQRFYFDQFEGEDTAIISSILPIYDHTAALFNKKDKELEFCVLAYDEELNGSSYEKGFADAVVRFLKSLQIEKIIIMMDLCRPWDEFGFDTNTDRLQFKKLVGGEMGTNGYLTDHSSLAELLPLLFHNNPDEGDCSFYTATADFQLCILYWKGNLHTLFYKDDLLKLIAAAKEAKLVIGSRELSHNYHFGKKFEY